MYGESQAFKKEVLLCQHVKPEGLMLTEVHQTEGANIARSDLHVELKSKQNSETVKMVTPSMQRVRGQRNIWPRMQTHRCLMSRFCGGMGCVITLTVVHC